MINKKSTRESHYRYTSLYSPDDVLIVLNIYIDHFFFVKRNQVSPL